MKIILVSIKILQEYIIYNIKNLKLFNNNDITVITEKKFFYFFEDYDIELIDCKLLEDFNFNKNSNLDKQFRNGFWHLCSLRFFYLYSYIKKNNIINCIHLENDVLTYIDFNNFFELIKNNNVYVTFDCENRVIPGIIFIPNAEKFKPIIDNYNYNINDMENLAKFDETIISPFPIFPIIDLNINKLNKNFKDFNSIFDGAAIGQYLGGVDKRNQIGDTRGFINETCLIKYDKYNFFWIRKNNLFIPHIVINNFLFPINNLHIHNKELEKFMANNPIEDKFIKKIY
jgi:hypothetical protein